MKANELYLFIIKKVHPDLNPNLKDATLKTQELNKNINNLDKLIKLGEKWKLLPENFIPKRKYVKREVLFTTILNDEDTVNSYIKDYVKKKYGIDVNI